MFRGVVRDGYLELGVFEGSKPESELVGMGVAGSTWISGTLCDLKGSEFPFPFLFWSESEEEDVVFPFWRSAVVSEADEEEGEEA